MAAATQLRFTLQPVVQPVDPLVASPARAPEEWGAEDAAWHERIETGGGGRGWALGTGELVHLSHRAPSGDEGTGGRNVRVSAPTQLPQDDAPEAREQRSRSPPGLVAVEGEGVHDRQARRSASGSPTRSRSPARTSGSEAPGRAAARAYRPPLPKKRVSRRRQAKQFEEKPKWNDDTTHVPGLFDVKLAGPRARLFAPVAGSKQSAVRAEQESEAAEARERLASSTRSEDGNGKSGRSSGVGSSVKSSKRPAPQGTRAPGALIGLGLSTPRRRQPARRKSRSPKSQRGRTTSQAGNSSAAPTATTGGGASSGYVASGGGGTSLDHSRASSPGRPGVELMSHEALLQVLHTAREDRARARLAGSELGAWRTDAADDFTGSDASDVGGDSQRERPDTNATAQNLENKENEARGGDGLSRGGSSQSSKGWSAPQSSRRATLRRASARAAAHRRTRTTPNQRSTPTPRRASMKEAASRAVDKFRRGSATAAARRREHPGNVTGSAHGRPHGSVSGSSSVGTKHRGLSWGPGVAKPSLGEDNGDGEGVSTPGIAAYGAFSSGVGAPPQTPGEPDAQPLVWPPPSPHRSSTPGRASTTSGRSKRASFAGVASAATRARRVSRRARRTSSTAKSAGLASPPGSRRKSAGTPRSAFSPTPTPRDEERAANRAAVAAAHARLLSGSVGQSPRRRPSVAVSPSGGHVPTAVADSKELEEHVARLVDKHVAALATAAAAPNATLREAEQQASRVAASLAPLVASAEASAHALRDAQGVANPVLIHELGRAAGKQIGRHADTLADALLDDIAGEIAAHLLAEEETKQRGQIQESEDTLLVSLLDDIAKQQEREEALARRLEARTRTHDAEALGVTDSVTANPTTATYTAPGAETPFDAPAVTGATAAGPPTPPRVAARRVPTPPRAAVPLGVLVAASDAEEQAKRTGGIGHAPFMSVQPTGNIVSTDEVDVAETWLDDRPTEAQQFDATRSKAASSPRGGNARMPIDAATVKRILMGRDRYRRYCNVRDAALADTAMEAWEICAWLADAIIEDTVADVEGEVAGLFDDYAEAVVASL